MTIVQSAPAESSIPPAAPLSAEEEAHLTRLAATEADEAKAKETAEALNPCQVCGSMSDAGPEGAKHSAFGHCWKCGFRPGQPVPAGTPSAATGLTSSQIEKIAAELRKGVVDDILAALRSGATLDQVSATYVPPSSS